ncbi:MAG: hypothetical protein ACTSU3_07300 [Candidatus Thorarchaeota archaeon]
MSEPNERLRQRAIQVAQLSQKIEVLQAQLGGSHRRANQLGDNVSSLESVIGDKDSEIQMLRSELSKTQGALESVGKTVKTMKVEQTQLLSKKPEKIDDTTLRNEVEGLKNKVVKLKEDIKLLSEAATSVLHEKDDGFEILRETLRTVGDTEYKILNIVLDRRTIKIDEIASTLVEDTNTIMGYIDGLQTAGEVQLIDGVTVIPAIKYREVKIPDVEWKEMEPTEIFDSLEELVGKAEGKENVVEALEKSVDVLEQKMSRGGALIFQMRRMASTWSSKEGSVEELQYTIREWKARAISLS